MRLVTFQALGGAKAIASTHLERKIEKLRPEERQVCSKFFDRLVTPSGAKVACRLDDLVQWAGEPPRRFGVSSNISSTGESFGGSKRRRAANMRHLYMKFFTTFLP